MRTFRLARLFVPLAALAVVGVVAIAGVASPAGSGRAAKQISGAGVGAVEMAAQTHKELRDQGLVGKIRRGCELGGPTTRSAKLLPPLKGQVNYTLVKPRTVVDITVRGGAKARGVGIGATIPAIKAAFPKAKVDHSTDDVFALTLVRIPKNGGGRFHFGVSTTTNKTTVIGVRRIAFCE